MVALIEKETAEFIGVKYSPMIEAGIHAAIIEKQDADRILRSMFEAMKDLPSHYVRPQAVNSIYDGLKVIVHAYSSINFLDTFTDGHFKEHGPYLAIINEMPKIEKACMGAFLENSKKFFASQENPISSATITSTTTAPTPVETSDPVGKALELCYPDWTRIQQSNNKFIVCINDDIPDLMKAAEILCLKLNKHVILCAGPTQKSHIELKNSFFQDAIKKEELIVLDLSIPNVSKNMLIKKNNVNIVCLGKYVDTIYQFQCARDLHETAGASIYTKFDRIFKDTLSGTIFAVFKRPYLMSLIPLSDKNPLSLIVEEVCRRWNGITQAIIDHDKALHEESHKLNIEAYIKVFERSQEDILSEAKSELLEASEKIGTLEKELAEQIKIYQRYMSLIMSFDIEKYRAEIAEKARKNIEDALKLKYIKSIFVDNDGIIHVYTKNIYSVDPRSNKTHDIGTFHIQLNMLNNTYSPTNSIIVKNTKHNIVSPFGSQPMEAPHIFNGGHICHGNLITAVTQHYAERDLYALLVDIISFLESVNVSDPAGSLINLFPVANLNEAGEDEFEKELQQSFNARERQSANQPNA